MIKKGLTLIEIVVALAVFMIVVAMVFPIMTRMSLINIESGAQRESQELGTTVVEEVLALAKSNENHDTLIASLRSTPLPRLNTQFVVVEDNFDETILVAHEETHSVTIIFTRSSNLVKFVVTTSNQKYETLEWLRFYDT